MTSLHALAQGIVPSTSAAWQHFEVWKSGRCVAHVLASNAADAIQHTRNRLGGEVRHYTAYNSTRDPLWRRSDVEVEGMVQFEADWLGFGLIVSRSVGSRVVIWSVQRLRAAHKQPCEVAGGTTADIALAQLHAARAAKGLMP